MKYIIHCLKGWLGVWQLCVYTCVLGGIISNSVALPAFPGAEGYGSDTQGGRGGKVIQVTNLKDSGPGSFRAAVEAEGARIVVFRVSGTIPLLKDIVIKNPNLTVAGQTAPGDGVALKNYQVMISARDVIVRHLRFRRGRANKGRTDALSISWAENVIVDHCSISWGTDQTLSTWIGTKNITVQWSIISEALHHNSHGFAASIGGVNASYHHLLIANCPGRNPSIAGNHEHQTHNLDFRNSVIFNFGHRTFDGKPSSINIVNNYFKPGPNSTQNSFAKIDEAGIYAKIPTTAWYLSGNYWEGNPAISKDNASGCVGATQWITDEPAPFAPVKTVPAEEAYEMVLAGTGATKPKRDPVDLRIIEETRTGKPTYKNGVILNEKDVGGWPELKSSEAPMDTDKDGIPDEWENKNSLNPNDRSDGSKDKDGDGYTNIEEYLNELAGDVSKTPLFQRSAVISSSSPRFDICVNANGVGKVSVIGYNGNGNFEIFHLNGSMLYQGSIKAGQGRFHTRQWPFGSYYIRFRTNSENQIRLEKSMVFFLNSTNY